LLASFKAYSGRSFQKSAEVSALLGKPLLNTGKLAFWTLRS
jgi:hypothetical protein